MWPRATAATPPKWNQDKIWNLTSPTFLSCVVPLSLFELPSAVQLTPIMLNVYPERARHECQLLCVFPGEKRAPACATVRLRKLFVSRFSVFDLFRITWMPWWGCATTGWRVCSTSASSPPWQPVPSLSCCVPFPGRGDKLPAGQFVLCAGSCLSALVSSSCSPLCTLSHVIYNRAKLHMPVCVTIFTIAQVSCKGFV